MTQIKQPQNLDKVFEALANKHRREITRNGAKDLSYGPDSIAGYTIIKAKNLAEAEKTAEGCPMISTVRVYEAMPM